MSLLLTCAWARSHTCGFQSSLNLTRCEGMQPFKSVQTWQECRAVACSNSSAQAWQFCPTSFPGCQGWASSRCWVGGLASGPPLKCPSASEWMGESRLAPPPRPSPATRKRGFSGYLGKDYTCEDQQVLGLNDSWYYTWTHEPSQHNKCTPGSQGREFVPMLIGLGSAGSLGNYVREWGEANAHYVLGYNEPDFGNGHNHPHMCSPEAAAKDWPKVQAVAAAFDPPLTLVSPAMSTTGVDDSGRSAWLDMFFGNCSAVDGCDPSLIKYIAYHDYNGNVTRLLNRVRGLRHRYGVRVWLTEFAYGKWSAKGGPPRPDQDAYMREVLPALDASDDVFRYAWFTARNAPDQFVGGSNLLPANSSSTVPTSTGRLYDPRVGESRGEDQA